MSDYAVAVLFNLHSPEQFVHRRQENIQFPQQLIGRKGHELPTRGWGAEFCN